MNDAVLTTVFGTAAALAALAAGRRRVQLSLAKHRSLAGHARMARRLASLLPGVHYNAERFFNCDQAPEHIVAQRRAGFDRLASLLNSRHAKSIALTSDARESISDLQFTSSYRVPFQFSQHLRTHLRLGSFLQSSEGVSVTDLDGVSFFDLSGSYGVNLMGYDFYKECMAEGFQRAQALGPVLGNYHPSVAWNVRRLREISGLDEVSFHMSGTEAVMQAVRLARYHTRRSHLVRFCGAYHGWWDDVQPGPGNPLPATRTYTLKDMDERALHVLRTRRDIACVLVNPLQALHPNQAAPGDSSLVDSSRKAGFDRAAYTQWLGKVRDVCTQRGIVLILDEVFVGFRLAPGGAQEYFKVQADLVTYGKTLGGGLPVGVLCGRRDLMKRFREAHPADICFARGTFNSHPYVMTTMQVFLERLASPRIQSLYVGMDRLWNDRANRLNTLLREAELPIQVANLATIWTLCYTQPSRYNWMLQFYMRAEGLALSWVGTGRFIFSLNFTDHEFNEVCQRILRAAEAMKRDGWWHPSNSNNQLIRRDILMELLFRR